MSQKLKNVRVLSSLKRATAAQLAGCDVEITLNQDNQRECLYLVSPETAAAKAVSDFEEDRPLPAKSFLDAYVLLYHESKSFIRGLREQAHSR